MKKERKLTKQEERRAAKYPDTETFHWYNENPRGKITDDCYIRAIATATGKTWEEVADALHQIMMRTGYEPGDRRCFEKYLQTLGFARYKQPRKDDGTKYTGREWCEWLNKHGTWADTMIAHIGSHHIVAIMPDSNDRKSIKPIFKVIDHWNSTSGCIGMYWRKP